MAFARAGSGCHQAFFVELIGNGCMIKDTHAPGLAEIQRLKGQDQALRPPADQARPKQLDRTSDNRKDVDRKTTSWKWY